MLLYFLSPVQLRTKGVTKLENTLGSRAEIKSSKLKGNSLKTPSPVPLTDSKTNSGTETRNMSDASTKLALTKYMDSPIVEVE